MFRFATDGRVRWPVTITQVQPDGSTAEQTFGVVYTILDRDELRAREARLIAYNRAMTGLYPAAGEQDTAENDEQRRQLTEARVAEDDAALRERITGWDGIEDQDEKALPFSPEALGALLRNALMRQTLLVGLIDASHGAPSKNSQPGLAGMPVRAQA